MTTSHYETLMGLAARIGKEVVDEVDPANLDSENSKGLTELWATAQVLSILAAGLREGEVCSMFGGLLAQSWKVQVEADPQLREWLKFDEFGDSDGDGN